ncbi:pilus assembly protein [Arenimonas oryziterrae]|uniref:PilY1 beta-propeller domain-containing protein n=1 Tax=Arenimonas oryziterrae DSM 21050 = YC6267 TaxID=1121015 RepID=A0A091B0A2_9GAMM|nr:PilC/PilY family type IV pilus protein [Arenimonas oryziterrae]KFN44962.1 hypothetical protein N789_02790 [Arenimonas oryziterrae DSM 21050 = YC6267]
MTSSKTRAIVFALIGTLLAGQSGTASATPLDISESPLFLNGRIKPAFIIAVDDSGSMTFETLFPGADGQAFWLNANRATNGFFSAGSTLNTAGDVSQYHHVIPTPGHRIATNRRAIPPLDNYGFSRSPEYNPAYFNPAVTYGPWKDSTGLDFANASVTATRVDPRDAVPTINLFSVVTDRADDADTIPVAEEMFVFQNGMIMPNGSKYYLAGTAACGGLGATAAQRNTWVTLAAATTVTASCEVGFQYYPAVFYLKTTTPAPAGFTVANRVLAPNAGGIGVDMYRYEIKPANYAVAADYTNAQQNFANWFSYYGDRMRSINAALTRSLADVQFMRIGMLTINDRNPVTMWDMDKVSAASQRASLYTFMSTNLRPSGSTPNRQAVDYIGQQFQRTDAAAPVKLACQVNAGMLFTDGYSNQDSPIATNNDGGMGSPFADGNSGTMADIATKYYLNTDGSIGAGGTSPLIAAPTKAAGQVAVSPNCNVVPLDKKLDCQTNLHMNFYGVTLGAKGYTYGVNAAATADPYTTVPAWPSMQNDNPSTVDDIWHATVNTRGKFINASTPQAVSDAMAAVLNSVLDSAQDAGTQSLTGARIGLGTSFIVEPSFKVRENGVDWSGELTATALNDNGSDGAVLWQASGLVPAAGSRNILTTRTPGISTVIANATFVDTNLGGTETAKLATLGINPADIGAGTAALFPTGTTAAQIVTYLRGDTTMEKRNGGPFRNRTTRIGDIVNSIPAIASKYDNFGYQTLSGAPGTTYTTYFNTTKPAAMPIPVVYVGANDGMLHAFRGDTGVELFGYIPQAVIGKMGQLANKRYDHTYYVDGQINVADVYNGTAWKTYLIGTAGAGGRSIYGLDVSRVGGTAFAASDIKWELNSSIDSDIGLIYAKPVIVPVRTAGAPRWIALVPNGYNSTSEQAILLAIDVFTGQIIKKIPVGAAGDNGLGQIAVVDLDKDGNADTVYGGDLQGNLWKFDISNINATSWSAAYAGVPVFTARDAANAVQPITGGLEVTTGPNGNRMIVFGTGRYLVAADASPTATPQIQTIYAVVDTGSGGVRANLQAQTILTQTTVTVGTPPVSYQVRATSGNPVDYAVKRGWYMDLKVSTDTNGKGEMFIGRPIIDSGTVYMATFEPVGDECSPGGKNWFYGLSTLSGISRLGDVKIGLPNGSSPCASGGCGAIGIGGGAPVINATIAVPKPVCQPGTPGCSTPLPEYCPDPPAAQPPGCIAPGSDPPAPPGGGNTCPFGFSPITIKVQGLDMQKCRPTGRQSWRQLR